MRKTKYFYFGVKRFFDFTVALLLLLLTFPLWLIIAVVIYGKMGRPVLFCQPRPGKNEKIFLLYKFRTMSDQRDQTGRLLSDRERLTPLGNWLRHTSLDELPQMFNVLKGDMSLIGPRPLLTDYLPLYNDRQHRRHDVRPGISGWAQVNGRNALSWSQKFEFDLEYVEKCGFQLDAKIFLLTLFRIIRKEGISADGEATMKKFGSEEK
ncbi:sugar transferase [Victivallis sp. Marseille-Q1083]|uniref:sugar transferase n=1 Tax=Victivallis sp. Marseille-Q1083 TaxID=2717288 RepID=UPI001C377CEF|nr:sugar transferase [Victivallis sp. Marseille-Q1083]